MIGWELIESDINVRNLFCNHSAYWIFSDLSLLQIIIFMLWSSWFVNAVSGSKEKDRYPREEYRNSVDRYQVCSRTASNNHRNSNSSSDTPGEFSLAENKEYNRISDDHKSVTVSTATSEKSQSNQTKEQVVLQNFPNITQIYEFTDKFWVKCLFTEIFRYGDEFINQAFHAFRCSSMFIENFTSQTAICALMYSYVFLQVCKADLSCGVVMWMDPRQHVLVFSVTESSAASLWRLVRAC